MTKRRLTTCLVSLALAFAPVWGATAQPAPAGQTAPANAPATPPSSGPNSGTAPGNEGSTGWTGGGSFSGTANHAPTPGSPTAQPETVQGLNPTPSGTTPTAK